MESSEAFSLVGKQAAVSLSVLGISVIAESAFGGPVGLIISLTVGAVCLAVDTGRTIHQRNFEEKLRCYAIEQYRSCLDRCLDRKRIIHNAI